MQRRTAEQGQKLVEAYRESGKTQKAWCKTTGVPFSTLNYWTKTLSKQKREAEARRQMSPRVQWAAIVPEAKQPESRNEENDRQETSKIRLMKCGYEIEVESGFAPGLLESVLQVVNRVCC